MTHSKYNTRPLYRFGDATKAFIAANPVPPQTHHKAPWTAPTEDLGQLPSDADSTPTVAGHEPLTCCCLECLHG